MFPINGKDYDSPLLAINQVSTHPCNERLLDNYFAAIADPLSSTESLRTSALEVTISFLGRASNTELLPGIEEALLAGVREGVQRVARLDREDLAVVVNQVSKMGSTTDAWCENLHDNINLDMMCDIIDICKKCPLNAVNIEC